jgi:cytochrome c peroxidase
VINRAYSTVQFWDGRAATLEEQAKGPMINPIEMGNTHAAIVATLENNPGYRRQFSEAFTPGEITIDQVAQAIAAFERTVLSSNAPYDRYQAGERNALSAAQVRGMKVFFGKAKCDQCHGGQNFTNEQYHNLGIGSADPGRFAVTHDPRDWGAFKTPTLREIANTAPYMHDGSLKTLDEVVDYYGHRRTGKPLGLGHREKKDLVEFLHALSGTGWQVR